MTSHEGFLEYAPAPESAAILHLRDELRPVHRRRIRRRTRHAVRDHLAGDREAHRHDRRTRMRRMSTPRSRPRAAPTSAPGRSCRAPTAGKYLFRIARLVQERARELAVAESLDNGKPIKESRDVDIPLVAAWFFYYAGWADKLDYAGLGAAPRALGVAAQVIPWNFPLLMLAWKIAPALAAGNTVVLKPAETTPLSALLFAEILQQARPAGRRREHPHGRGRHRAGARRASRMSTRSPSPGRRRWAARSRKSVAGTGKKLTLELGGKAANIVFDDAPIDQAIEGIVNGIFFNQGHVCCAGSRLLVQENIHDEVVERLKQRLSTLRLGDPLDKNTDIGAINSREQLERIRELSDIGEAGGRRALDGRLRDSRERVLVRADHLRQRRRPRAGSRAKRSSARCSPC